MKKTTKQVVKDSLIDVADEIKKLYKRKNRLKQMTDMELKDTIITSQLAIITGLLYLLNQGGE